MPLYLDEQRIEEVKVTFDCKCGQRLFFHTWNENLAENPYVDVECKCGTYYKNRGSINKHGGKVIKIEYTGKFL